MHRLTALVAAALLALCGCAAQPIEANAVMGASHGDFNPVSDASAPLGQIEASRDAYLIEVKLGQTMDDVTGAAVAVLGNGATVERLFPGVEEENDPENLSRIYRVKTATSLADPDQWDKAYAIKAKGNFENVEPDTDTAIEDAQKRQAAAACIGDTGAPAPANRNWSLLDMRVPQARKLKPPPGGKLLGEGVRICHPDTGWAEHDDLDIGRLDTTSSLNLVEGGTDAKDPMNYSGNPGHGTATGSVIVSSGDFDANDSATPPGTVNGLAPNATLVPIRAIKRVVQVFDSDIARAVQHASNSAKCDVISMSLGGKGFFGLEKAIKDAIRRDVIVVSAAGNCVGMVVAPASYEDVVAVAATNARRLPWKGTSQGRAVSISAPGESVYVARAVGGKTNVAPGNGTSFATAAVAGAAANWLAFHGKERVKAAQGTRSRQAMFMQALSSSADPGSNWESDQMGPGILNLEKLLSQPLPSGAGLLELEPSFDVVSLLQGRLDLDRAYVEAGLRRLLGNPSDLDGKLAEIGPEVVDIATRDPDAFKQALTPAPAGAFVDYSEFLGERGSATLKSAIQR